MFGLFKPSAAKLASQQIEENKRLLVHYETQELYAKHMAAYHREANESLAKHAVVEPFKPLID